MRTVVFRWGNSFGVRIPHSMALAVRMSDGDEVDVSVQDGAIVIRAAKRRYTIEELVADIRPGDRDGELDWGSPLGREAW
jgi:antitoxin MazE